MHTIGFLGSGNMAEALIKGIGSANLYAPEQIFITDINPDRLALLTKNYGVQAINNNPDLAARVDTLVLSVKPRNIPDVLPEIEESLTPDTLLISIAAGIRIADITAILPGTPVIRVMPNTPALIGQGAAALVANKEAAGKLQTALAIFSAVGKAVVLEDESLMDAVTAVSGSGPAYFFLLAEEMINAACELNLPYHVAKNLVLQTAKGAALLAVDADKAGQTPADLRKKVTSPGGTTEAALKVLAGANFASIVKKAVRRACERSRELSL